MIRPPATIKPFTTQTKIADYLALCKLKVVAVMLITSLVGMLLASDSFPSLWTVAIGLTGIALVTSAGAAINHVMDEKIDSAMQRTKKRPLPQGKVTATQAMLFALIIGATGIYLLGAYINAITAWLTMFSLIGYAFIYTVWLKRATPQNIVVGGLAGAAPPLLGWTAVSGEITSDSLLLVLIIFAWTPPHFWALALFMRSDYDDAGVPMLTVTHGRPAPRQQILSYSIILVATSIGAGLTSLGGPVYLAMAVLMNAIVLKDAWAILRRDEEKAELDNYAVEKRFFKFSLLYLFLHFVAILAEAILHNLGFGAW